MADTRFDGYPTDARFSTPGVDGEHSNYPTDDRFPSPGTDTRFTGGMAGGQSIHTWTIGEQTGNYGYLSSQYGDFQPPQLEDELVGSLRLQTSDGNLYLVPSAQLSQGPTVSYTANGNDYSFTLAWGGSFYFANAGGQHEIDLIAELGNDITVTIDV